MTMVVSHWSANIAVLAVLAVLAAVHLRGTLAIARDARASGAGTPAGLRDLAMLTLLAQRRSLYPLETADFSDPSRAAAAAGRGVDVVIVDRHDLGRATFSQEVAFEVALTQRGFVKRSDDLGIVVFTRPEKTSS